MGPCLNLFDRIDADNHEWRLVSDHGQDAVVYAKSTVELSLPFYAGGNSSEDTRHQVGLRGGVLPLCAASGWLVEITCDGTIQATFEMGKPVTTLEN